MKPLVCLLVLGGLFSASVTNALQLQWSTGADTLKFTQATSATLLLAATGGETRLPDQWQLLWVADSIQLEIVPVDPQSACFGDTAQVRELAPPTSAAEVTSHLTTATFCAGAQSTPVLAAWRITFPARARGRLQAYGFDDTQPTGVTSSNIAVFNGSVFDWFTPNATVLASHDTAIAMQSVTLSAVVVPVPPVSQSVTFKEGESTIGSVALSNGLATLLLPSLTVGTHVFTVTYDTVAAPPCSVTIVLPTPTTTDLSISTTSSRHYQAVQLSASVAPSTATGNVQFLDSGVVIAQAPLSNGTASLITSSLEVGSHLLQARYVGDVSHLLSTSQAVAHQVTSLIPTTVSIAVLPDSLIAGRPFWIRASVTPTTVTGDMIFEGDIGASTSSVSVPMVNGEAFWSVPEGVCGGGSWLRATFNGDSLHYGNYDSLNPKVMPHDVRLSIHSTKPQSRYTEAVNFVAVVTDTSHRLCELDGYVTFYVDSVWAGTYDMPNHDSVVSNPISDLSPGPHWIYATFSGSLNRKAAPSVPILQEVEIPRPVFVSIRDVFGDQGGQVKLTWEASYLDLEPFKTIEAYWVLRSAPAALVLRQLASGAIPSLNESSSLNISPGVLVSTSGPDTTYFWEYVGAQPALHLSRYSFVAATTTDSTPMSNPYTPFMLMARTTGGAEYWFSDPDSGYSVDNLSPPRPQNLTAAEVMGGAVSLFWQPIQASDFYGYRLHRGRDSSFTPDSSNLVYAGLDAHFTDDAHGAKSYYKLCAVDIHGNVSPFAQALAWSAAEVDGASPLVFGIEGLWPNPSRGGEISCVGTVTEAGAAQFEVLDVAGRRVDGRVLNLKTGGRFEVRFGLGRSLPPGLYLVRLRQGHNSQVRRFILLN